MLNISSIKCPEKKPGYYFKLILFCLVLIGSSSCSRKKIQLDRQSDPPLACGMANILGKLGLNEVVNNQRLVFAVADITRPDQIKVASANGHTMLYAASTPKIAILFGLFKRVERGELELTPEIEEKAKKMIQSSCNQSSAELYHLVGPDFIRDLLTSKEYKLYDVKKGGGLWVGKEYGKGKADFRDPLRGMVHAATPVSLIRFYYLLENNRLVNRELTIKMKEILSSSTLHTKFLQGLEQCCPDAKYLRKAGGWRNYSSDSILVEYQGRKFIVAALADDPNAEIWLRQIFPPIVELIRNGDDGCVPST